MSGLAPSGARRLLAHGARVCRQLEVLVAPLNERLRRVRKHARLTQKQLEQRSGVPQNTISRIEIGAAQEISTRTLIALAGALGVTTDYLLGLSETATPPRESPSEYSTPRLPRRTHGPRRFRRSRLLPYRAELVHQRRTGATLAALQRWLRTHRVRVARSTIKRYLDQLPELHDAQLSPPSCPSPQSRQESGGR